MINHALEVGIGLTCAIIIMYLGMIASAVAKGYLVTRARKYLRGNFIEEVMIVCRDRPGFETALRSELARLDSKRRAEAVRIETRTEPSLQKYA